MTSFFQEQRAHIQILDSALSNAQATILRLEEENRMKEGYAERVKQMTRSLEQLQAGRKIRVRAKQVGGCLGPVPALAPCQIFVGFLLTLRTSKHTSATKKQVTLSRFHEKD